MEIHATTKPTKLMRYATAGDYLYNPGIDMFWFIIAQMKITEYEMLIFLHEYIESMLCWSAGIDEKEITAFDKQFEKDGRDGEPGDAIESPYFKPHQIASRFEMMFCDALGVNWAEYSKAVDNLFKEEVS
jgi:hypothetical protein